MLEKACYAVEQAGRGGGVFPEVLVDVAKQWDWIHQQVKMLMWCSSFNCTVSHRFMKYNTQLKDFYTARAWPGGRLLPQSKCCLALL